MAREMFTVLEWKSFWKDLILKSVGKDFNSFEVLQEYLENQDRRILFIVDGLEELLGKTSESEHEKVAIRALCQGVVNELRSFVDGRIGLIVFLRNDVAMNSIKQNWGQFRAQYTAFELKWTHVEALRLALWLANKVDSNIYPPEGIAIENATREILERSLYPLWGVKLGKPDSREAYSANWIINVLSDLNGQLQARDMVRFLFHAAIESQNSSVTDRYLAPKAIRSAIKPCSEEKIKEIGDEMPMIEVVFNKFRSKPLEQRQIPFQLEDYDLSSSEVKLLDQQGYLVELDDGYYMPEIIRLGLGFKIQKKGRPKVFSLANSYKR